jgi:hypothetical protein
MPRILLATGDDILDDILRNVLGGQWEFSDTVIDLRQHIIRKLQEEAVVPDILIVHDKLFSEYETKQEKDQEWLHIFGTIRKRYPHIRIVFMGVRDTDDLFLLRLINLGIYDIFINKEIKEEELISQLSTPASYANISRIKERLERLHFSTLYGDIDTHDDEPEEDQKQEISSAKREKDDEEDNEEKEAEDHEHKRILQELFKWASGQMKVSKPSEPNEPPANLEPPPPKVIEKIIEVNLPTLVEPKLVAIGSLYPECGSTWVACHLAQMLAEYRIPVGVLEFPSNRPYLYDRLNGQETAPKNWECWYSQIKTNKKVKKGTEWRDGDIYWIPLAHHHHPVDHIDQYDLYALLASSRQIPIVLVDLSSRWDAESVQQLLNLCDEIWVVTKPNPVKWKLYYPVFEAIFQFYNDKTFLVGNCWTPYVKQKDMINHFNETLYVYIKPENERKQCPVLTRISHYDPDLMIQAEIEGTFDLKDRDIRQSLQEEFDPLLKRLVPESYLRQQGKKESFFKRLIAR